MLRPFLILAILAAAFGIRQPAQAATTLNACQRILTSGDYVLGQNVSASETCFSIRASNVTLNGNGKTITVSAGEAVEVAHYSGTAPTNVVVKNFSSSDGVRTYGDAVSTVTFENLTVSGITVYGSDDVTIRNNTVGQGGINVNDADNNWPPRRPVISGNTITGGSVNTKILLEVAGGKYHPCPRIDAKVTNNTVTSTRNDPPPEATAGVRVRCATHTTFTGNTIRSTGTTIGLYIRDEADHGLYENNVFWTNTQEAFRSASGNVDKTYPAHNTFRNNIFRSDQGTSNFFQGIGGSNTFTNNLFWANTTANGGTITAAGNTYDHNTFYNARGGAQYMNFGSGSADTFTNNIFVSAGARVLQFDGYSASRFNGNHNLYYQTNQSTIVAHSQNLAQWQQATSAAGSADDAQSLSSDPKFVNVSAGNFGLQSTSPAIGAGSNGSTIGQTGLATTPPVSTDPLPAPSIVIGSPSGTKLVSGTILITTSYNNPAGTGGIARVNFYINGVKFSSDTGAPYRAHLDTRPLVNGTNTIRAEIVANNGTTRSTSRNMVVRNGMVVRMNTGNGTSQVSGIAVLKPRLVYGAYGVAKVSFFRRTGQLIGTDTTSPHQVNWDTRGLANGVYRVRMVITDTKGRSAYHILDLRVKN